MAIVIDGSIGPYSLDMPGGYGRNASCIFKTLEADAVKALINGNKTLIDALQTASVRYTPSGKLAFFDAFGYAEEEIHRFDILTRDNALDLEELTGLFEGNAEVAGKYLKALDRNGDGKVDVLEYAVFILFSDDATNIIANAMNAFGSTASSAIFNSEQQQELKETAQFLLTHYPTQLDGQITMAGKRAAEIAVLRFPMIIGIVLDQLRVSLDLHNRYEQYKTLA